MYKSLLSDYEASQKSLMLENAELKKVLQQMKKEMIHILSPRSSSGRGATADDSLEQVFERDTHTHTPLVDGFEKIDGSLMDRKPSRW